MPVCTSRAASSARAPLRWYSCSTRIGWPGAGGVARWHRARALDGGLGVDGDNAVTGAQRLALAEALAQIKDHGRPGGEVRVAGEDSGLILPGLDRVATSRRAARPAPAHVFK